MWAQSLLPLGLVPLRYACSWRGFTPRQPAYAWRCCRNIWGKSSAWRQGQAGKLEPSDNAG